MSAAWKTTTSPSLTTSPLPDKQWIEPPFYGFIETTEDALLILEAARRRLIPRLTRRLSDHEKKALIASGSVFVFGEGESGIRRWTDSRLWSPSRILGNFLIYRETEKRNPNESQLAQSIHDSTESASGPSRLDRARERVLLGSLTNSTKFKVDGMMKKTFSLALPGTSKTYHIVSYYKVSDVGAGRLRTPSSLPELAALDISSDFLERTHFRVPLRVELGEDGRVRYRDESLDDSKPESPPLQHQVFDTVPRPSEFDYSTHPSYMSMNNSTGLDGASIGFYPPRSNLASSMLGTDQEEWRRQKAIYEASQAGEYDLIDDDGFRISFQPAIDIFRFRSADARRTLEKQQRDLGSGHPETSYVPNISTAESSEDVQRESMPDPFTVSADLAPGDYAIAALEFQYSARSYPQFLVHTQSGIVALDDQLHARDRVHGPDTRTNDDGKKVLSLVSAVNPSGNDAGPTSQLGSDKESRLVEKFNTSTLSESPEDIATSLEELANSLPTFQQSAIDIAEQAALRVRAFDAWSEVGERDRELSSSFDSMDAEHEAHKRLLAFRLRQSDMQEELNWHLTIVKELFQLLMDKELMGAIPSDDISTAFVMAWIAITRAEELESALSSSGQSDADAMFVKAFVYDIRKLQSKRNGQRAIDDGTHKFDEIYLELVNCFSKRMTGSESTIAKKLERRHYSLSELAEIAIDQFPLLGDVQMAYLQPSTQVTVLYDSQRTGEPAAEIWDMREVETSMKSLTLQLKGLGVSEDPTAAPSEGLNRETLGHSTPTPPNEAHASTIISAPSRSRAEEEGFVTGDKYDVDAASSIGAAADDLVDDNGSSVSFQSIKDLSIDPYPFVETALENQDSSQGRLLSAALPARSLQLSPTRNYSQNAPDIYVHKNIPISSPKDPMDRATQLTVSDLPYTVVRVRRSDIRTNERGKQVLSFVIAVDPCGNGFDHTRKTVMQGWLVEKLYSEILELDTNLRNAIGRSGSKQLAPLPDGKLLKDNAPAKVDQRKIVLETYIQSIVSGNWNSKDDVLTFLSTGVVRSEQTNAGIGHSHYKEGYLTKRTKNLGVWKRRYYVLQSPILEYYESRSGQHLGSISIAGAQLGRQQGLASSEAPDIESSYRHALLIIEAKKGLGGTPVRHVLCAESDEERDSWVETLLRYVGGSQRENYPPWVDSGKKDGRVSPTGSMSTLVAESIRSMSTLVDHQSISDIQTKFRTYVKPRTGEVERISTPIGGAPIPAGYRSGKDTSDKEAYKSKRRSFWGLGRISNPVTGGPTGGAVPQAVFGVTLEASLAVAQISALPAIVYRCIEFLEVMKADEEVGIYRIGGEGNVITNLKRRFDQDGDVDLLMSNESLDHHVIAGLLKKFLRELPQSILTRDLHLRFLDIVDLTDPDDQIHKLAGLISQLPPPNYTLLRAIIAHLILIVQNSDVNKMTARNIGIVFSPTLGIPASLFTLMLSKFEEVFDTGRQEGDGVANELSQPAL